MNKQDLIVKIASDFDLTKVKASNIVNTVFDTISAEIVSGNSVGIAGFGSFSVRDRAARTGRNPQTGEALAIPARKVPAFRAGKGLKDVVNA